MATKKNSKKKKRVPRSSVLSKGGGSAPGPGTGHNPIAVKSRSQFEEYLSDERPVIVDFWAPWCGPCRAMAPTFEQVGKEFQDKVHFLKLDTEELPDIAGELGIRSIPTMLVFHGDEVTDSRIGLTDADTLRKLAQKADDKAKGVTLGAKVKRLFGGGSSAAPA